jgi:hypothetical protein
VTEEIPIAPGMEGLMQRGRRQVLPPKRPAEVPAQGATKAGDSVDTPAGLNEPEQLAPKTRIKRQPRPDRAESGGESIGDVSALVNLNIRVRRGIDDRIATCAFGLREFGLRNVSKAELVELAVLQGPLPATATAELAEKLMTFRSRFPRP